MIWVASRPTTVTWVPSSGTGFAPSSSYSPVVVFRTTQLGSAPRCTVPLTVISPLRPPLPLPAGGARVLVMVSPGAVPPPDELETGGVVEVADPSPADPALAPDPLAQPASTASAKARAAPRAGYRLLVIPVRRRPGACGSLRA